jgi:HSP20 family protein
MRNRLPFDDFFGAGGLLDNAFDNAFKTLENTLENCDCGCGFPIGGAMLRSSIKESDENYTLIAEVPGLTKDNIKVSYKDGTLTIVAEWKSGCKEGEPCPGQLRYGKYTKAHYLPDIDGAPTATMKDGLLTVVALKKPAQNIDIGVDQA